MQNRKRPKKLVNRINVTIQSASFGDGHNNLLNISLPGDSARTNADEIVNCHSSLEGGPTTMIPKHGLAGHIRPQLIRRDNEPGNITAV